MTLFKMYFESSNGWILRILLDDDDMLYMIAFTFFLFAIVNRYSIQQSGDELSPSSA
jgi:hypothetical protein